MVAIECTDNGKRPFDAAGDVGFSMNILKYYAGLAPTISGRSFDRHDFSPMPFKNQRGIVKKHPVGVCGIITPFNFPLLLTTFKLAPMLAAGCTGVIKPAH